jgi:hypothetical protein
MSYMPVTGMIGNNLAEYPVAGISMGLTPMGLGSYGSPMKIKRRDGGIEITSPVGMPIATTFGNETIVSNPFGGLSGMSGINPNMFGINGSIGMGGMGGLNGFNGFNNLNPYGNFSGATLGFANMQPQQAPVMGTLVKTDYSDKGINISVTGCKSDVDKVIKCLKDHLV